MPFAVFRRHQRKMLATFAILAMFAFVLSDSLTRLSSNGAGRGGNVVVVDLYGKPVYRSDLEQMAELRRLANGFVSTFRGDPTSFGGTTTRELIDALILKHEADRLGLPESSEFARAWLKQATGGVMNRAMFDGFLRQLGPDVSGEQVLACIASQLRLQEARRLLGSPVVTPLDVYRAYRDQNERSSFRVVSFPAKDFLDKVGEPTTAEVQSLYDSYKDVLPDPLRDTPGFKVPREVSVEILSVDGAAMAQTLQAGLTEAELRAYYETRKPDFSRTGELPTDLFKDDPTAVLTPTQYIPFEEVKDALAAALGRERAQERIGDKLDKIKDEVLDTFSDKYQDAVDENAESKKAGETQTVAVPTMTPLAELAKAEGLTHEVSPLLTYDEAKSFGQIGSATVGLNPDRPGDARFADALFAPKSPLYEGLQFSDQSGRRYLVRKLSDVAAHVAPLDDVRSQVVAAWKLNKARALAEAAAKELAEKTRKDGGRIKEEIVAGRPVLSIASLTRLTPGMPMPGAGMQFGPPTPSELREIPNAGEPLRTALFALKPGAVEVAPDGPKGAYYVLTLDRRDPAGFNGLYGPSGMPTAYLSDAYRDAILADDKRRMEALRDQAGLKPGWVPADEKARDEMVSAD